MNKKAEKIINTTIKLFLRDGYRKITMDDIAQNANVSKVTIYKYFVDKDQLYDEVCRHIFLYYTNLLKSTVESAIPLQRRLYEFLDILCEFTDSGRMQVCTDIAQYSDAIETHFKQYLQAYQTYMLTLIDEGMKRGLIKMELDRDMVFHYIDMGVNYYTLNDAYRNRMRNESDFCRRFMLFHIGNIFADVTQILPA